MRLLIYTCPRTNLKVQAMIEDDLLGTATVYAPLDCPLCKRTHIIKLAACGGLEADKSADE